MSKTWYGHHIDTIKGNDYVLFKDYLELDKTIEEKDEEIDRLTAESTEWESKCYKYQDIIDELEKDLKTLWNVCWNNDTEMTSYQSEIFDKYYDKFHKKELKEGKK